MITQPHTILRGRRRTGIVLLALLAVACVDPFSTRYERIDPDLVRPLSLVFEPAEAAPGDTVKMRVWFAGKPVTALDWKLGFNVVSNIYGTSAVKDQFDLMSSSIVVKGSDTLKSAADSSGESYATVSFVVPPDIISKNEQMLQALEQFARQDTTGVLGSVDSSKVAGFLQYLDLLTGAFSLNVDSLLGLDSSALAGLQLPFRFPDGQGSDLLAPRAALLFLKGMQDSDSLRQRAAALARFVNAEIRVYLTANKQYRAKSAYTVRYSSHMRFNPYAYPNRNPQIDWIAVYRVKGTTPNRDFDFGSGTFDAVYYLWKRDWSGGRKSDTVEVDNGYVYYLGAGVNAALRDTGINTESGFKTYQAAGTASFIKDVELLEYRWMYRNDDPIPDVNQDSLVVAGRGRDSTVQLFTPAVTGMKRFSIFLTVNDEYVGEFSRPRGFAFQMAKGVFRYTEAYKSKHK